jgi:orotidine-5'-phosphate decarboxylase
VPDVRGSNSNPEPRKRLFVPLDTPDPERALGLVRLLHAEVGGFKIGLELFTVGGPALVSEVREHSPVFVDLKFHDIPNTVGGAAAAIGRLGVSYFTMHAAGGPEMIRRGVEAAASAAANEGVPPPTVLAVSVLTSHDDETLSAIGMAGPCSAAVARLAVLAREAGAGGLVCSAHEVERARAVFPDGVLAVPGIRPAAGATLTDDDQVRTATPDRVVCLGADLLIVGRPITRAADPVAAAKAVVEEIRQAMPRGPDA